MTTPDYIRRREGMQPLKTPAPWTATVRPTGSRLTHWAITVSQSDFTSVAVKYATTRRRAERKAQRWVDRLERGDRRRRGESFTVEAQQ